MATRKLRSKQKISQTQEDHSVDNTVSDLSTLLGLSIVMSTRKFEDFLDSLDGRIISYRLFEDPEGGDLINGLLEGGVVSNCGCISLVTDYRDNSYIDILKCKEPIHQDDVPLVSELYFDKPLKL